MIIEGLCTTTNPDGTTNIAPMGPIVNEKLTTFLFRPFQTSTTFQNLKATGCGVFHVTDDVDMIARAAIGELEETPELLPAEIVDGQVIASACRWYEFALQSIDESNQRSEISTTLKHVGHLRDYWGLNRARNAILEAAILATRLHILDADDIQEQMQRLELVVEKTANAADAETFQFLKKYVASRLE